MPISTFTYKTAFKASLQLAPVALLALLALALKATPQSATSQHKPVGNPAATPGTPLYKNADYLYAFQPPVGWNRKTDMPKQTVAFLGPEEDNFTVNLTVTVFTRMVEDKDLEKFANDIKIEHAEIFDKKSIKLAGRPAYMWRTHLKIPDHPAAEDWEIVSINNSRAYELVFTVPPTVVEKYKPVFEKWLASFTWTRPTAPTKPKTTK